MPLIDKHGALWHDDPADVRTQPVYEHHDAAKDLLAVVVRNPSGYFVAAIYEKISDHQWRSPFWSARRPDALFADQASAVEHVMAVLEHATGA
jgi:hypothetical protein